MKKPASPKKTEKRAKVTPEEKSVRKSAKKAGRAATLLNDDRADNKAWQKKTLKTAAKQLQKELNKRMNEVVTRIRKETKAKLKEVVKEATRRLDGDTERMFEQALHTIVRHYDSVAGGTGTDVTEPAPEAAASSTAHSTRKGQTLNKDGTPRKARTAASTDADATADAPKTRGRKPATTAKAAGARRGPKAAADAAPTTRRGPKPGTPATGARRGPKPRAVAASEPTSDATAAVNSTDSASTGEASA